MGRTAILGTTMQPFSAHALGPRNAREACLRGPAWLPDCGSASDSRMQESGSGFAAIRMLQIQGGRSHGGVHAAGRNTEGVVCPVPCADLKNGVEAGKWEKGVAVAYHCFVRQQHMHSPTLHRALRLIRNNSKNVPGGNGLGSGEMERRGKIRRKKVSQSLASMCVNKAVIGGVWS